MVTLLTLFICICTRHIILKYPECDTTHTLVSIVSTDVERIYGTYVVFRIDDTCSVRI